MGRDHLEVEKGLIWGRGVRVVSSKIILCLDCLPVKGAARWLTLWDCYGGGVACFLFSVGLRTSAKLLQSCPTLCNLMDCSLSGPSVHGILQARMLEWVDIPFSRGSSQFSNGTQVSDVCCIGRWVLYQKHHLGSPFFLSFL